jgi:hypothetical protein
MDLEDSFRKIIQNFESIFDKLSFDMQNSLENKEFLLNQAQEENRFFIEKEKLLNAKLEKLSLQMKQKEKEYRNSYKEFNNTLERTKKLWEENLGELSRFNHEQTHIVNFQRDREEEIAKYLEAQVFDREDPELMSTYKKAKLEDGSSRAFARGSNVLEKENSKGARGEPAQKGLEYRKSNVLEEINDIAHNNETKFSIFDKISPINKIKFNDFKNQINSLKNSNINPQQILKPQPKSIIIHHYSDKKRMKGNHSIDENESIDTSRMFSEMSQLLVNNTQGESINPIMNQQIENSRISEPKCEGRWESALDSDKSDEYEEFTDIRNAIEVLDKNNVLDSVQVKA